MGYAFGSALFAGMTAILAKIGINNTDSNLATALRTIIVLLFSWLMVFVVGSQHTIGMISVRSLVLLIFSGGATGLSWLCYYRALQEGKASLVVPVDKLSIVVAIVFSRIFLKEKLTGKAFAGLLLVVSGTMLLLF